jgi:hypothetical protein
LLTFEKICWLSVDWKSQILWLFNGLLLNKTKINRFVDLQWTQNLSNRIVAKKEDLLIIKQICTDSQNFLRCTITQKNLQICWFFNLLICSKPKQEARNCDVFPFFFAIYLDLLENQQTNIYNKIQFCWVLSRLLTMKQFCWQQRLRIGRIELTNRGCQIESRPPGLSIRQYCFNEIESYFDQTDKS